VTFCDIVWIPENRRLGHRYERGGLEAALYEKQRPGAAEVLDSNQKQRIIAMVCSDPLGWVTIRAWTLHCSRMVPTGWTLATSSLNSASQLRR